MNYTTSNKKKRIWSIIIPALIVVVLLGVVMMSRNQEGYRTIKVFEVSGKVGVVNQGVEYEAYPGMILQEGSEIVTSSDSYVRMILDGDKYIKLESGSRIVFEEVGLLGSGKTAIKLERGIITNEIVAPLSAGEDYVIHTPNAVLAVRGTFFKVDLKVLEDGDTTTDVLTYGGTVASKRIMPDGNVVDEEVLVDSGYMTTVQMNPVDTFYVVKSVDTENSGNESENTVPISKDMISDADLIDIYFAAENGHEMFLAQEELEETLAERGINIEDYTPVYIIAGNVGQENVITSPDDGIPLVREGEPEMETVEQNQGVLSDGTHKHEKVEHIINATCTTEGKVTVCCDSCGEVFSEEEVPSTGHVAGTPTITKQATCTENGIKTTSCIECGEQLEQEVISKTGHTLTTRTVAATCTTSGGTTVSCSKCGVKISETKTSATGHRHVAEGGTAEAHSKCVDCGAILSTEHSYTDTVTQQPTCTEAGKTLHACTCGYSYTTEIEPTGHIHEVDGGTADAHIKCADCGTVLSTRHDYTDTVTQEPGCTDIGEAIRRCACGYSYTVELEPKGHTEEYVGTMNFHSQCADCGMVLSTEHEYTDSVVTKATCVAEGSMLRTCDCGYDYLETIPVNSNHRKADENGSQTTCADCGCTLIDFNSYNFPDTVLLNLLKEDGIDTNDDGILDENELMNVKTVSHVSAGITDASGIQYFTELTTLDLLGNAVSDVPCASATKLTFLSLGYTDISSIDVSMYPDLISLQLCGTEISSLDLSNNGKLEYLNLASCSNLTTLDVSNNTSLENIQIQGTSLTDFSVQDLLYLEELWIDTPTLAYLSVTNCPRLTRLELPSDSINDFESLNISGCTALTSVSLGPVKTTLRSLEAYQSGLSGVLDLSNFTALQTLNLRECMSLVGLNIKNCATLLSADAAYSGLAYVNAEGCATFALDVSNSAYSVPAGTSTVDMTIFEGFDPTKVSNVNGGGYSPTEGVFYLDFDTTEITYDYTYSTGLTATFTISVD